MSPSSQAPEPTPRSLRRQRWLLGLLSRFAPSDQNLLFAWAAGMGLCGALCALFFHHASSLLLLVASGGIPGDHVAIFSQLPAWQRIAVPAGGGLIAGLILLLAQRYVRTRTTDYMEAIALGDGNVPLRASLVRALGSLICYSAGESVGREGPLVQLAGAGASFIGRFRRMAPARKRMLVACGAAAGLSASCGAPLASAIFVAEVVLGSLAMEGLGPLLIASVVSSLLFATVAPAPALFEFSGAVLGSNWDYLLFPVLGLVAGAASVAWLHTLRLSKRLFGSLPMPIWVRLFLGGLAVGLLACWNPELVGNGAHMIHGILGGNYGLGLLAGLLLLRVAATSAAFGSGALGGVFTPTLLTGAAVGSLFCGCLAPFWPAGPLSPAAFALAAMGGFLAASAQSPVTALLMVFELTRRYDLMLPLALCTVAAYSAARAIRTDSLYAESLSAGPRSVFDLPLSKIRVGDIMRPGCFAVRLESPFRDIAASFLADASVQLWVVARDGRLLGRILLSDVEPFLKEESLALTVIAGDIMQEEPVSIPSDADLPGALGIFTKCPMERLPVVEPATRRLVGSLSRNDLFLLLAELSRREQTRG